ncbi:MAG TPA: hypothetical protein VE196_06290, partial [Pseudonocardiaceae bacterium]|nr:hypothetical protein [Pseudonocardiaceae bacterium]
MATGFAAMAAIGPQIRYHNGRQPAGPLHVGGVSVVTCRGRSGSACGFGTEQRHVHCSRPGNLGVAVNGKLRWVLA